MRAFERVRIKYSLFNRWERANPTYSWSTQRELSGSVDVNFSTVHALNVRHKIIGMKMELRPPVSVLENGHAELCHISVDKARTALIKSTYSVLDLPFDILPKKIVKWQCFALSLWLLVLREV